jgi:hypothetical protein
MATVVTYNGVELHNVTTRQWDEELVYDSSGTDLLFRRIKMRFQGIAHRSMSGMTSQGAWGPAYIIAPGVSSFSSTPEIFNTVRPRLLMPRQRLKVEMNGMSVLEVKDFINEGDANLGDMDAGPKPRAAVLAHVAGDQVFRIDFAIDCAVNAKNSPIDHSSLGGGTVVLNNRWTISESVGDNFAVTRTIRGHLRLSKWVYNSQYFRTVVVPPLENSFRRDKMDFQVSDNGLDCEYTIVDKQVKVAAPWPACKMEATYTQSTNDATMYYGDVAVTLEGPISASVQLMMVRAMQIIDTRLQMREAVNRGIYKSYELIACSLTEHIGERNIIEAHVRVRHTLEPSTTGGVAKLYTKSFGQGQNGMELVLNLDGYPRIGPSAYNLMHNRQPELFGYLPGTETPRQAAFLIALGCYYQDPWHPQLMSDRYAARDQFGTTPNISVGVSAVPDNINPTMPETDRLSPETRSAAYTYTRLETRYMDVECNAILPIASAQSSNPKADTAACVSLAPAQFRREIHYDHERIGTWPETAGSQLIYQDGDGLIGVLLKAWDRVMPSGLTADKTQAVTRIEGYRLYALNRRPLAGEKVRTGILPNTNFTQDDMKIDLSALTTDRMYA